VTRFRCLVLTAHELFHSSTTRSLCQELFYSFFERILKDPKVIFLSSDANSVSLTHFASFVKNFFRSGLKLQRFRERAFQV